MKRRFSIPESIKTYGMIFLLIVLSFYIAAQFIEPAPPRSFTLATGPQKGAYANFGKQYTEHLAKTGTKVTVKHTKGSFENLELLKQGKADFAFVQSGLVQTLDQDINGLQSLGAVYFEPLWIFIPKHFPYNSLRDFKDISLAIGNENSGTNAVAKAVLQASGVSSEDVVFLNVGGNEALNLLLKGEVDAVFMSAGVSSSQVIKYLDDERIVLFSVPRAAAYDKTFPFLSHLTLPEGVLDLRKNIPEKNIQLLASAALIVASPEAHHTLRSLLVQTASEIHRETGPYLENITFPTAKYSDFPVASEAKRYYESGPSFLQKYLPFWVADLVDRLKVMLIPLLTIMLPLMKIAPPTYRWRIRSKIYKWYRDLKKEEDLSHDSRKQLHEALERLEEMDQEAKETAVPLSYTDALYNLRMHIQLVRQKLNQQKDIAINRTDDSAHFKKSKGQNED